jgi:hypothetical protein
VLSKSITVRQRFKNWLLLQEWCVMNDAPNVLTIRKTGLIVTCQAAKQHGIVKCIGCAKFLLVFDWMFCETAGTR